MQAPVALQDVLAFVGFVADPDTGDPPKWRIDFGGVEIKAVFACDPRAGGNVYCLIGYYITPRGAGFIEYNVPAGVATFELGLALIAYGLRNVQTQLPKPAWFEEATALKHHLPWEQERAAYDARPLCLVKRDWFKLGARDLHDYAEDAPQGAEAVISFDGAVLAFDLGGRKIVLPAHGKAWSNAYAVAVEELLAMPRRFMKDTVWVDVWEKRVRLGRLSLPILSERPCAI
jgi:hypothetical protein